MNRKFIINYCFSCTARMRSAHGWGARVYLWVSLLAEPLLHQQHHLSARAVRVCQVAHGTGRWMCELLRGVSALSTWHGAAHRVRSLRCQHRSSNRTRSISENLELIVHVLVCDNRTAQAGRGSFPQSPDARSAFARERSGAYTPKVVHLGVI